MPNKGAIGDVFETQFSDCQPYLFKVVRQPGTCGSSGKNLLSEKISRKSYRSYKILSILVKKTLDLEIFRVYD